MEAVIYGEVTAYSRTSLATYSQVAVRIKVRMFDGKSGPPLSRHADHWGGT